MGTILALLTGLAGPLSTVASVVDHYLAARAQSQTDVERAKIDAQLGEAKLRQAELQVEISNRVIAFVNALVRFAFAAPFIVYNAKCVLWDKVIMAGMVKTDPLSPELFQIELACVAFYLVYDITARFRK